MKELYLAGKITELLAAFEGMKGVEEVVAGRAKASGELEVKCVRVQYNPKKTDICELLKKYFNEGVNPYIIAEDPWNRLLLFTRLPKMFRRLNTMPVLCRTAAQSRVLL